MCIELHETAQLYSGSVDGMQELKCSWCLQDVVTRGGKFLFLYKRPGKRVIVNDFGHFIVAPNSIEASIQQNTVGTYQSHRYLQSSIVNAVHAVRLCTHLSAELALSSQKCLCIHVQ